MELMPVTPEVRALMVATLKKLNETDPKGRYAGSKFCAAAKFGPRTYLFRRSKKFDNYVFEHWTSVRKSGVWPVPTDLVEAVEKVMDQY